MSDATALDWTVERQSLALDVPFSISRGTTETRDLVFVEVSDGDHVGLGGAAPSAYYGETVASVEAVLPDLLDAVDGCADPLALQSVHDAMRDAVGRNPAARAAVDVALHDLVGKRHDAPLYRLLGTDPARAPDSCFSLGIAAPETLRERAAEAVSRGVDTLKVKVGRGGVETDVDRVATVREAAPDATLHVDANGAYTPREAVRAAERFADHDVAFLEGPVPADDPEGLRFVHDHTFIAVAADEACVTAADAARVADRADLVVVKLMKCGGLRPALEQIHAARAHGLDVLLGCMVESHASLAAAAHLAPLCDYVDLDGTLLLADDPVDGPIREDGRVALDDTPGTGAVWLE